MKYGHPNSKISLPALPDGLVWAFPKAQQNLSIAKSVFVQIVQQKYGVVVAEGYGNTAATAMADASETMYRESCT